MSIYYHGGEKAEAALNGSDSVSVQQGDGEALITAEKQQLETAEAIADFWENS